ncbi:hypothetical protein HHL28_09125 [Aerophototrophica crusticola]|uniref:Uncharacterized protein n=1 Tax=Aerophototrophica crusticola TaxID=1709002 RepID=A0A858R6P4_9PROT|nr:hypothetical protein HHL28_09125 [Rhodospirillaceae bacterium B3]
MDDTVPTQVGTGRKIAAIFVASLVAPAATGVFTGIAMLTTFNLRVPADATLAGRLVTFITESLPSALLLIVVTGFFGMILGAVTAGLIMTAVAGLLTHIHPGRQDGSAIGLAASLIYLALGVMAVRLTEMGTVDVTLVPAADFIAKIILAGFTPCFLLAQKGGLAAGAVTVAGTLLAGMAAGKIYAAIRW